MTAPELCLLFSAPPPHQRGLPASILTSDHVVRLTEEVQQSTFQILASPSSAEQPAASSSTVWHEFGKAWSCKGQPSRGWRSLRENGWKEERCGNRQTPDGIQVNPAALKAAQFLNCNFKSTNKLLFSLFNLTRTSVSFKQRFLASRTEKRVCVTWVIY